MPEPASLRWARGTLTMATGRARRLDALAQEPFRGRFSAILRDNYKETSYAVAMYRWHAENPSKKKITVSVLLSWTNMMGWLRGNGRDFRAGLNEGNYNSFHSEKLSDGTMKGLLFERKRGSKQAN